MATFKANHAGIGRLLNSEQVRAAMLALAEKVKAEAEAIAPVSTGEYKASFVASSGTRGGVKHDRAYGRVTSTDPAARYIEFGTEDTPKHRTLSRALGALDR